jgi:glutamyl/glutaminyl-tRNA synthetase
MLYRGRLAPSPTGLLHLGHAATFWQAFTRARDHNGTLLLRNEDVDPHRSRLAYLDAILEDLAWLGIEWCPPLITQSHRVDLYHSAFNRLLQQGSIYPCHCSRRDLALMMHAPHEEENDEPVYNGHCRPTHPASPLTHEPASNYRFRVPEGEPITFTDINLGPQSFTAGKDFGDFLIWRRDNLPSYQLACIIDDADTQITEVVRGADLLKSTARQILLHRALNLPTPSYFHTHLLRDEHGLRLAKRHDALAIRTLRQQGLTSSQVISLANHGMTSVISHS